MSLFDVLFDYQRRGVDFLVSHKRALLADEMGLGKTIQTIGAIVQSKSKRTLIICPNSLKWTWAKEIQKWAPELTVTLVDGSEGEKVSQIARPTDVTIVNYETFRYAPLTDEQREIRRIDPKARIPRVWSIETKTLEKQHWTTVVLDEAHRAKNRDAQTTKGVRLVTRPTPNVYLLTGTPILNRVEELWSLLNLLDSKKFSSYWAFVMQFCEVSHNGFGLEIGEIKVSNRSMLLTLLDRYCLRRLRQDVLPGLPGKLPIEQIWIPLTGSQRRVYDEMATEMYTQLTSGETIWATMVIAQITRLKQIAIDPTLMVPALTPLQGAKISYLFDSLLPSLDATAESRKIVIFSQFSTVLDRLEKNFEALKIPTVKVTGEITGEDRQTAVDRFQEDPSVCVFLCGMRSGGMGITLTASHTAIFLDKFWSPTVNWQAQDRLDRIGQSKKVTIIELLALDTIEEGIEELLDSKISDFSSLFSTTMTPTHQLRDRASREALLDVLMYGVRKRP